MGKIVFILTCVLALQVHAADTSVTELSLIINKWDSLTDLQQKEWNTKYRMKQMVDGWGLVENVEEVKIHDHLIAGLNDDVAKDETWKVKLNCPIDDTAGRTQKTYCAVLLCTSSKGLSAINKGDLLAFGGMLRSVHHYTPDMDHACVRVFTLQKMSIKK